jgi:hypothetical protein
MRVSDLPYHEPLIPDAAPVLYNGADAPQPITVGAVQAHRWVGGRFGYREYLVTDAWGDARWLHAADVRPATPRYLDAIARDIHRAEVMRFGEYSATAVYAIAEDCEL